MVCALGPPGSGEPADPGYRPLKEISREELSDIIFSESRFLRKSQNHADRCGAVRRVFSTNSWIQLGQRLRNRAPRATELQVQGQTEGTGHKTGKTGVF